MPEQLHAALARQSEREGVSLNAFITGVLADAVAPRAAPVAPRAAPRRARRDRSGTDAARMPGRRPRGVSTLLLVNLVVVTLVGLLALALLVEALR